MIFGLHSSMAQKESSHKDVVDDLTDQLAQVRKQHEDLQVLSRDQVRPGDLRNVGPVLMQPIRPTT